MVVYALKKNGKLSFGTPVERRSCATTCVEHDNLVELIDANRTNLKESIDKNREAINTLDIKIDSMARDLNTAVGFIKAKTGGNL